MKLTCLFAALFSLLCAQVQTELDHHRHRHRSQYPHCQNCPPGWGVSIPCTKTQQNGCSRCPDGYYSKHHSYKLPCWPCSLCGDGLFVSHKCSSVQDTVCDSCQTYYKPHASEDFRKKCQIAKRKIRSNLIAFDDDTLKNDDSSGVSFENFIFIFIACFTVVFISYTAYSYILKKLETKKYKNLQKAEAL